MYFFSCAEHTVADDTDETLGYPRLYFTVEFGQSVHGCIWVVAPATSIFPACSTIAMTAKAPTCRAATAGNEHAFVRCLTEYSRALFMHTQGQMRIARVAARARPAPSAHHIPSPKSAWPTPLKSYMYSMPSHP